MNILTDCIRADGEYKHLLRAIAEQRIAKNPLPIVVAGLCEGAADAAYAALAEDVGRIGGKKRPVLLVCPEEKECMRLVNLFRRFAIRAEFFVARDLNFYNIVASHEYEHERLKVLSGILCGELDVIVTTPDAALTYTIPPEKFISSIINIEYDKTVIEVAELAERLIGAGYVRAEMVDAPGQFATRGGIVDIYPPHARFTDIDDNPIVGSYPLRIELFGDEIDRMELFDVESQRMTVTLNSAELSPAREILIDGELRKKLRQAIETQFGKSRDERACAEMVSEIAAIDGGVDLNFSDKYITLIYPERVSLFEYLSGVDCVLIKNTSACYDKIKAAQWHLEQSIEELLENGTIAAKYTDYAKPSSAFDIFVERNPSVHFDAFGQGMSGKKLAAMFTFRTKHMVSYADNYELLCEDLEAYGRSGFRVIVTAENEAAAKNLCGYLNDKGFSALIETDKGEFAIADLPKRAIMVKWRQAIRGYELTSPKIVVLSTNPDSRDGGYFAGGKLRTSRKKKSAAERIMSYNDLSVGDFVVHEVHGIGQYMGIENLTVDGVSRDYINIRYAGSDKLFLPTDKLDMISKYIGAHSDDGLVKLSKFGGGEWTRAKAKAKAAVKEMAKELIKLYAERMRRPGFAFPEDDDLQRDFEAAFEYDETAV